MQTDQTLGCDMRTRYRRLWLPDSSRTVSSDADWMLPLCPSAYGPATWQPDGACKLKPVYVDLLRTPCDGSARSCLPITLLAVASSTPALPRA